jgi:hypothetical protein
MGHGAFLLDERKLVEVLGIPGPKIRTWGTQFRLIAES